MKVEKILQSKLLRFLIPGIVFVVSWMIYRENFSRLDSVVENHRCERRDKVKSLQLYGTVTMKYKDFRELRMFKYFDGKDTIDSDLFIVEGSDFYNDLKVGDTIRKDIGSLEFKVRRFTKDFVHELDYGCE